VPGRRAAAPPSRTTRTRRRTLREELEAREVPIERGPERMFYDCTEMEALDPDGYALCFGQCD
jgi:hypothetical protein